MAINVLPHAHVIDTAREAACIYRAIYNTLHRDITTRQVKTLPAYTLETFIKEIEEASHRMRTGLSRKELVRQGPVSIRPGQSFTNHSSNGPACIIDFDRGHLQDCFSEIIELTHWIQHLSHEKVVL